MNDKNSSGFWGLAIAISNRHKVKKELRRVEKANLKNVGIIHYQPSDVEAFVDRSEPGNMIFSGGNCSMRIRALMYAAQSAFLSNRKVIVIHCQDSELEKSIANEWGVQYYTLFNQNNQNFDPFSHLSNEEIAQNCIDISAEHHTIGTCGASYIQAMCEYIRSKGFVPTTRILSSCPYLEFVDKVNAAENAHKLSAETTNKILMQIMRGESERANIEIFFNTLVQQGQLILVQNKNAKNALNIREATKDKIVFVDIISATNILLLDAVLLETEKMVSAGEKITLIIDDLSSTASKRLLSLMQRSNNAYHVVLAGEDVYSTFEGNDDSFFAFAGKCKLIIASKHTSSLSCQRISDIFGEYEKLERSTTYSDNRSFYGHWGLGASSTASVNAKREKRVKPEMLQTMNSDEIYVLSSNSERIAHTELL